MSSKYKLVEAYFNFTLFKQIFQDDCREDISRTKSRFSMKYGDYTYKYTVKSHQQLKNISLSS